MRRSRWTEHAALVGLAALYFGLVTPLGWAVRTLRDPLRRHWDTDRDSYLEPPPRGLR
ncbi:hypothetical protein [Streptomyces sp. NPDC001665]